MVNSVGLFNCEQVNISYILLIPQCSVHGDLVTFVLVSLFVLQEVHVAYSGRLVHGDELHASFFTFLGNIYLMLKPACVNSTCVRWRQNLVPSAWWLHTIAFTHYDMVCQFIDASTRG